MSETKPLIRDHRTIAINHVEAACTEAWLEGYDVRTKQVQNYLKELEFSKEVKDKLIAFGFLEDESEQ